MYSLAPMALNNKPMSPPPRTTESMMRQLAIPVNNNKMAPNKMAMTDVSQVDPGMVPMNMSKAEAVGCIPAANSPKGVAPVMASVPQRSAAIQTLSPDMRVG